MAGTVVADTLQAASTSTLVLKNGVANTPPTIQDSAGTEIGTFCRAWVNLNGTLAAASMIRASFNVSSITDNGTGDYTVNFTTAMPDANYAAMGCYQYDQSGATAAGVFLQLYRTAQTTSAVRVTTSTSPGVVYDGTTVTVAVFR